MAFTPNSNLTNSSQTILRDQQHGDRIFNADQFRLAPKHKFLFHVAFNINPIALKSFSLSGRHNEEINLLVKSVDLPSFKINTVMLNQYNRKKVMQTGHTPGEISIKFHDDNMSLINQLWQNYYGYYYADTDSAHLYSAYSRNATKSNSFITAAYGLDNGSTNPFFNYITIYQMARHEYVSYKLINPIITNWNHNKLDYAQTNATHDFDMKLHYESVAYGSGSVSAGDPEGFALSHYDNTPSPIGSRGGGDSSGTTFASALGGAVVGGIIGNALSSVNTYQNTPGAGISGALGAFAGLGALAGGLGGLTALAGGIGGAITKGIGSISSGLSGISFPGAGSNTTTVTAATSGGMADTITNPASGTPGLQVYDDGSSVQTLEDGSTLVTDTDGNVTSTDAPNDMPSNENDGWGNDEEYGPE
jgi:hypothetical protein